MLEPASPAKPPEDQNENFWAQLGALLDWALAVLGAASDIAKLQLVVGARRADILGWLRALERLARLGLVRMALGLPSPPKSRPRPLRPRPRLRRAIVLDPDKPETWPAPFRVLAREGEEPGNARAPLIIARRGSALKNSGIYRAWPLAVRLEAVRRVAENPLPYALRLRRALEARPQHALARMSVLARGSPQPAAQHNLQHGPADFLIEEAEFAAMDAVLRWDSS
jgi:hypothetical protein